MRIRSLYRVLVVMAVCVLMCACSRIQTYEIVLLPTELPAITQHTTPDLSYTKSDQSKITAETTCNLSLDKETESEEPKVKESQPINTPSPMPSTAPEQSDEMRFFVQRESEAVQDLFIHMYNAIFAHQVEIELPKNTKREHAERAMWLLTNDCPELFWFSHISEYRYTEDAPDIIISVTAKYIMNKDEAEKSRNKIEALISEWIAATKGQTDYEKELYVHDALLNRCSYSASSDHDGTIYGALIRGKARCEGYSEALCYTMRRMGIECAVLTGTATNAQGTESHAWNLLKIDGVWTLNDPTWNDPVGRDIIMYAYFNVTDAIMQKNHTLDTSYDRYDLPACSSMRQNHSVKSNCYVSADDDVEQAVTNWAIVHLNNDTEMHELRFENSDQYNTALEMLSECLQNAVNETKKTPVDGVFHYLTEPDANYLQFD